MAERKHITRGLRFTLTAVYTVVFTMLLVGVSLLFWQRLKTSLDEQARETLDQNWAVLKADMRIDSDPGQDNYHINWYNDYEDKEESKTVAAVQGAMLVTDSAGRPLKNAGTYPLSPDKPDYIRKTLQSSQPLWDTKRDEDGLPYLTRSFYVYDAQTGKKKFYVSIGSPLASSDKILKSFTWLVLGLIPLVIVTGCVMGWIFAGRALTPVLEIARTAQRISGSNLSLRIPQRGAGDELDRLTETFNQMIERIEVNFNQVRQFSTDVSHELRTPITVVRGQLEVALFTAKTVDQYRDAIVNSLSDIERLSQIVRALLLLSQAETGQVILQKQQMDLVDTVSNIVDQFQIPAEGGDVTLEFASRVNSCIGDFDRVQIERMLSNLLSNSIKFTPAGGEVRVTLDRPDGGNAEVIVEDTGEGISPQHLPHIFDRFYRVRGVGEQASPEKGLGLGLSFVAWIVRAHNGAIDVQSEPGRGTRFRVTLPLVSAEPQHPESAAAPEVLSTRSS